jgi:hypothetical protein
MHEQALVCLTETSLDKEVYSCLVLAIFVLSCLFCVVCFSRVFFFLLITFRTCKLQARRKHDAVMLRRERLHLKKEVLSLLLFTYDCLLFSFRLSPPQGGFASPPRGRDNGTCNGAKSK